MKPINKNDVSILTPFLGAIFGNQVLANTTTNNKWDSTLGVNISTTITWYKSGTTKKISSVSGTYTIQDRSISVVSSSVSINQAGLKGYAANFSLGTSNNWSRNVNFPYEQQGATVGGAIYTANLKRYSSNWSVTLNNTAWSFG